MLIIIKRRIKLPFSVSLLVSNGTALKAYLLLLLIIIAKEIWNNNFSNKKKLLNHSINIRPLAITRRSPEAKSNAAEREFEFQKNQCPHSIPLRNDYSIMYSSHKKKKEFWHRSIIMFHLAISFKNFNWHLLRA